MDLLCVTYVRWLMVVGIGVRASERGGGRRRRRFRGRMTGCETCSADLPLLSFCLRFRSLWLAIPHPHQMPPCPHLRFLSYQLPFLSFPPACFPQAVHDAIYPSTVPNNCESLCYRQWSASGLLVNEFGKDAFIITAFSPVKVKQKWLCMAVLWGQALIFNAALYLSLRFFKKSKR